MEQALILVELDFEPIGLLSEGCVGDGASQARFA